MPLPKFVYNDPERDEVFMRKCRVRTVNVDEAKCKFCQYRYKCLTQGSEKSPEEEDIGYTIYQKNWGWSSKKIKNGM